MCSARYIYTHIPIYIYIYIYIYRKIAARCTTRLARSRSPITGAAHTVIPIQRQHAHKIAISGADIEGRCVSLQKAQRKRRHDYPDAEVARRDRAAQSSQPTKNYRGSETAIKLQHLDYTCTRDRYRRKMSLASESAEEEETRLSRR